MAAFNWPALMRAGMRGLGLRPAEFWNLTPAELQLLLGQEGGGARDAEAARAGWAAVSIATATGRVSIAAATGRIS